MKRKKTTSDKRNIEGAGVTDVAKRDVHKGFTEEDFEEALRKVTKRKTPDDKKKDGD